jgi:hypothetical protein
MSIDFDYAKRMVKEAKEAYDSADERLYEAEQVVESKGWPHTFIFVRDEARETYHRARKLMAAAEKAKDASSVYMAELAQFELSKPDPD